MGSGPARCLRDRRISSTARTGTLALVLVTALTCALSACNPLAPRDVSGTTTLRVLSAASTRVLDDDLQHAASQLPQPATLEFQHGGSATLVQQLADGLEADMLITADRRTANAAADRGLTDTPSVVATNSLVMVVARGNPLGIRDGQDLDSASLVLCDPTVPCGAASEKIIERNGWRDRIRPVSYAHSATDALNSVLSGEADAAWVYRTDAIAAGDKVDAIELDNARDFQAEVMVAAVTSSTHPELANQLRDRVLSNELVSAWERHGFIVGGGRTNASARASTNAPTSASAAPASWPVAPAIPPTRIP